MKTFSAKDSEVQRDWYVIDATDKVLGRVASEVAHRLRGKHKPEFTPQDVYKRQHFISLTVLCHLFVHIQILPVRQ